MSSQPILTSTDPSVDSRFPRVTGTTFGTDKHALDTRNIGTGNLLEGIVFDFIGFAYPDSVTEVFTYKTGGSGGTTVATITAVYTTDSKEFLSSVTRS